MRFAHTSVEDPKYGARRRDAVISVARAPMPAPKTSAPSAKLPGRSPAAVRASSTGRRRARSHRASAPRAPRRPRRRRRRRARSESPPSASRDATVPSPLAVHGGADRSGRSRLDRAEARPRGRAAPTSTALDVPRGNSRNEIPSREGLSRRDEVICFTRCSARKAEAACRFPVRASSPAWVGGSRSSSACSWRSRP